MTKNGKLLPEEVVNLRNNINDGLTDIKIDPALKKGDALSLAIERGADNLTKDKLAYLVGQKLVKPMIISGDRDTHLYGRKQISDLILIQKLRNQGATYAQISQIISTEQYGAINKNQAKHKAGFEVVLPPQKVRAQTILYSRIMAVLLNCLLGDSLKPGMIILLRERRGASGALLPEDITRITQKYLDIKAADDYIGLIRPKEDLVAFVSSEPDREIMFHQFNYSSILEFNIDHWYLISVKTGNSSKQYDLLIGEGKGEILQNLHIAIDNFDSNIIAALTRVLFIPSSYLNIQEQIIAANAVDNSALLDSMVNLIPEISELWEYCVVLTSSAGMPNHLRISAVSRDFPKVVREEIQNIQIEPGQPMSGWVFQTHYPMIIQRTNGFSDPRLVYQNRENATAAIALPTKAQSNFNGVLYVGTRHDLPSEKNAFSYAEIRVLQIISDIVGEIIERNRITRVFEKNSSDVINLKELSLSNWASFKKQMISILEEIKRIPTLPRDDDNVHITIVKIESNPTISRRVPSILGWITEHVLNTLRAFFIRNGLSDPEIYYNKTDFQPEKIRELVCLIPDILLSDERDRELRKKLRLLLNSLKLHFTYEETLPIEIKVWSMPFRRKDLKLRMNDDGSGDSTDLIAREIISDIEDALLIIPYIERAHESEEVGAYASALEEYLTAINIAPNNRYIQRHVAKTYAALGDLKNSESIWKKIIEAEEHPRHLLRYAHVLARMGNFDQACKNFEKAALLDPNNQKILVEWADFLSIEGNLKEAIEKYERALRLEKSKRDEIWLRLAEVHLVAGNIDNAEKFAKLVFCRFPENQEALRIMLKVLKQTRR